MTNPLTRYQFQENVLEFKYFPYFLGFVKVSEESKVKTLLNIFGNCEGEKYSERVASSPRNFE